MLSAEEMVVPPFPRFTSALLFLLPLIVRAQTPNLSGTWNMDPGRSESAHQAVPIGPVTLVIRQTESGITIETRRKDRNTSELSTETLPYTFDGKESVTRDKQGEPIRSWAHWDGAKLITETARNVHGTAVTTNYFFSLDADGKELIIEKALTVQHGYQGQGAKTTGTGKDVFVRAKRQ